MNAANDNPLLAWSHIELSAGSVTAASTESPEGVRALPSEVETMLFFIEAVAISGIRLGLDSCQDYETAMRLAEEARLDFEIDFPVKDNVVGSH